MDKYLPRSYVSVISFPTERILKNYTGSALMNEDGGRSMRFSSLFGIILLSCFTGLAFSSETVKYLMNVFVRVVTFLINFPHELIFIGSGWQRRNRT